MHRGYTGKKTKQISLIGGGSRRQGGRRVGSHPGDGNEARPLASGPGLPWAGGEGHENGRPGDAARSALGRVPPAARAEHRPARRGVAVARRNGARRENDEDREHASAPATDQTWKRVRRPVSSDFQFWATKVSLTKSVCVGGGGLDRDPGPKRHQNPRPGSHQLGAVGAVTP